MAADGITLRARGEDGLRELDPCDLNRGFSERRETTFVGPPRWRVSAAGRRRAARPSRGSRERVEVATGVLRRRGARRVARCGRSLAGGLAVGREPRSGQDRPRAVRAYGRRDRRFRRASGRRRGAGPPAARRAWRNRRSARAVRAAAEKTARSGDGAGGDSTRTGERPAVAATICPAPGRAAGRRADRPVNVAPTRRAGGDSAGRRINATGRRADPGRARRGAHARRAGEPVHPPHAARAAAPVQEARQVAGKAREETGRGTREPASPSASIGGAGSSATWSEGSRPPRATGRSA